MTIYMTTEVGLHSFRPYDRLFNIFPCIPLYFEQTTRLAACVGPYGPIMKNGIVRPVT